MSEAAGGCASCPGGCGSDAEAGFDVGPGFRRFSQRDDVFSRSFWDEEVRSDRSDRFYESYRRPLEEWRSVAGYGHRDFALRNAAWHVADTFAERLEHEDRREGFLDYLTAQREGAPEKAELESPEETATQVKQVARLFGADLVGITRHDERWLYTHKYSRREENETPMDLPEGLTSVIVVCHEMDHDLLRTVPSALSGTATGVGYSKDVVTLLALAQYVRNLGYRAYASMNDTALSIPLAIQAGLGEYGRHGLLIAPGLGPRLRIGKVFTDLPLAHDRPRRFGVKEFCGVCRRCSDACPPGAIAKGEPEAEPHNRSNLVGVRKWTTDAEKCFGFWTKQMTDCSICVRVCPYNRKGPKWWTRWRFRLMGSPLRRWMLWIDGRRGGGERRKPESWWSTGSATS
ncbi:MAG: reductive dehalogenase domain-containing protein [Acidobacteriota bacterium]